MDRHFREFAKRQDVFAVTVAAPLTSRFSGSSIFFDAPLA
jgi:hypothetical protein